MFSRSSPPGRRLLQSTAAVALRRENWLTWLVSKKENLRIFPLENKNIEIYKDHWNPHTLDQYVWCVNEDSTFWEEIAAWNLGWDGMVAWDLWTFRHLQGPTDSNNTRIVFWTNLSRRSPDPWIQSEMIYGSLLIPHCIVTQQINMSTIYPLLYIIQILYIHYYEFTYLLLYPISFDL